MHNYGCNAIAPRQTTGLKYTNVADEQSDHVDNDGTAFDRITELNAQGTVVLCRAIGNEHENGVLQSTLGTRPPEGDRSTD